MERTYDVIVVGGGHAGCEATHAAAQLGCRVLLITMNMTTIAQMSCNPAMGGVAKGQIVRELDALGGLSGIVTDQTMIQFRMLNRSKGPAMWSPRAQSDRLRFAEAWRLALEANPRVDFWQEMVHGILVRDGRVVGVRTGLGLEFGAKTVVLTNGTFLNGLIHIGEKQFGGGRAGERASTGITEQLHELGFRSGRMKTGTPPRIDGRSIDYSQLEEQPGDDPPERFSYTQTPLPERQLSCHIGYTSPRAHEIISRNIHRSPLYNGSIDSVGPRYCPSIEDKIVRFAEKPQHQLFVEPEGWHTIEVYLNGFSSCLPEEVQYEALRTIPGFEQAKMFRPGYAIEYDFFPPDQLHLTLETQLIENLYFAGQINGTTGYEEAGAQGIIAGINAALKIREAEPFVLERDEAYIGVLIDDLIHKGTDEPYRMFTSRAEYRILLRQDNADLRLTERAYAMGLADEGRMDRLRTKQAGIEALKEIIAQASIAPEEANSLLGERGESPLKQKVKAVQVLLRPRVNIEDLRRLLPVLDERCRQYDSETIRQAEIQIKYQSYIDKECELAEKMARLEALRLPDSLNYDTIGSLSHEAREKLSRIRPQNLGQASRISGVSASDISVLMVYMGR